MAKKENPKGQPQEKNNISPEAEGVTEEKDTAAEEVEIDLDELAEFYKKAAETEKELSEEKDKYLRLLAEYENYRKRSQRERDAMYSEVKADTVSKLLPVYDNLARALSQDTEDKAFYRGVEMTMDQLKDIFAKLGVREIPALGEPFNPELHNAVMHIDSDEHGEQEIAEEFEKGFMLGDKVIRVSMVKVAN